MKNKDILMSLGLSTHEAEVYTSLLTLGPSSPTDIEKSTQLPRPTVYGACASLQEKGLLTITPKGKRKKYIAASPDKLTTLFKNLEEHLLSKIEDLHVLYQTSPAIRPIVTFSQSDRAIQEGYLDVIETVPKHGTYYRYSPGYEKFDRKNLPKNYEAHRDAKQLERYIIVNDTKKPPRNRLGRQVKIVPASFDLFDDKIGQVIYEDKVLIIDYTTDSVITIKNKKFAVFQKKLFKLLFSKL